MRPYDKSQNNTTRACCMHLCYRWLNCLIEEHFTQVAFQSKTVRVTTDWRRYSLKFSFMYEFWSHDGWVKPRSFFCCSSSMAVTKDAPLFVQVGPSVTAQPHMVSKFGCQPHRSVHRQLIFGRLIRVVGSPDSLSRLTDSWWPTEYYNP